MSQPQCSGKSIDQYYLLAAQALREIGSNLISEAEMMERCFAQELGPLDRGIPVISDYYSKLATIQSQLSKFNLLCKMNISDVKTKEQIMSQSEYEKVML